MPQIIAGYTTEQKVVTVTNDDVTVNAIIQAEAVDGWLVSLFTFNGSDMIILFTRTIPAS